ncbi:MAG: Crp/Fnr family transcriptional regulator [Cytophagales bacterium]|nr:Crp/Fnr family transcriptional regulator [Cytophagales bacterium]
MSFLSNTLLKYVKAKPGELLEISSYFEVKHLSKKQRLITAGELTNHLALIESGYMRMYRIEDGKETTVWIGGAGKFITSVSSFINQVPGIWNIEAITECQVHVIKRDSHFMLCDRYREWLTFENLLLSKAISALEYRTYELLTLKAEDRYQALFSKHPRLFLDIPARHIASLLSLSEETLSRLRKNHRDLS